MRDLMAKITISPDVKKKLNELIKEAQEKLSQLDEIYREINETVDSLGNENIKITL